MKDNRSRLQIYKAATKRLVMWHLLAKKLRLVLVTEFPKSGASWFCQMLSDASGIPFPRNESPKFKQSIMQGHHLFRPRMDQAIAVTRDGRDIMVSAYFYFLFNNDRNQKEGVKYHRKNVPFSDYDNVKKNMPQFIKYMFTDFAQKNFMHFSWNEFIHNVYSYPDKICIIKYEELLEDSVGCLEKALSFTQIKNPGQETLKEIVEKYSFKNVTKRKPGEENRKSFARKGISGDWKNYFNKDACETFKKYGGEGLIVAGYEEDKEWNA